MRISSDQNGSVENAYLGFEVRRAGCEGEENCGGGARVARAGRFKALAFERGSLAIVAQSYTYIYVHITPAHAYAF